MPMKYNKSSSFCLYVYIVYLLNMSVYTRHAGIDW